MPLYQGLLNGYDFDTTPRLNAFTKIVEAFFGDADGIYFHGQNRMEVGTILIVEFAARDLKSQSID